MYAVVDVPEFRLQAVSRLRREGPAGPCAVLDESGGRSRVVAANARARAAGVETGMAPARALARCRALQLVVCSPEAEARAVRGLLLLAQGFSPRIEDSAPGRVTADLRGMAAGLCEERGRALLRRLRERGLEARIGISDTQDHAFWAAGLARPFLRVECREDLLCRLPVEVLEADDELAGILRGWGVRTLAELAALPRAALGERLGAAGLELWDRAAGRRVRPLRLFLAAPDFRRSGEFEHRVETLEALLFILRRFVEELALELEAADRAAFAFRLRLGLEGGGSLERRVELPEPSGRTGTLFRVLESALEDVRTESAVVSVALTLDTAEARERQGELFGVVMEDAVRFGETADRVAALVGPGRSGSPRLRDSWRPDDFVMEPLQADLADTGGESGGAPAGPPFRRVRPPQPLRVLLEEGRPAAVDDGESPVLARAIHGPWRSSGGWWEPGGWSREEWDVELEGGALWRIHRESGRWFLEGIYG